MPRAATGKNMSPEKLARLEAIRAAKSGVSDAERATGEMIGEQVAKQALGIAPGDPGANPVSEGNVSVTAPTAMAATEPAAATGKNMSAEKLARLEAIRAAKRAQNGGS